MTREQEKAYLEAPSVGYWSAYSGVEVKEIEYGIDDYLICVAGTFIGRPKVHRVKIRYDHDRDYVVLDGHRFYLDDCLRTGY